MERSEFWDKLQDEQKAWSLHNFGEQPAWCALLGIVEESCGELTSAWAEDDWDAIKDAIGDVMIYVSDFCTKAGIRLSAVAVKESFSVGSIDLGLFRVPDISYGEAVGKLAHHFLKKSQGIRKNEDHDAGMAAALDNLVCGLRAILAEPRYLNGELLEATLEQVVGETWDRVKQRDWKRFPTNGLTS